MNATLYRIYDIAEMKSFEVYSDPAKAIIAKNTYNKIVKYERFIIEKVTINHGYQIKAITDECYGGHYIK